MVDSTSEPQKVVPLFPKDTQELPKRRGGGGGGENFGPRITKLEKQMGLVSKALNKISEDVEKIENRTRYLHMAPSHKEMLIWLIVAIVGLGSALSIAYYYLTPIFIQANQNVNMKEFSETMKDVDGKISQLLDENQKQHKHQ